VRIWICFELGSGFRIKNVALEDKNTYAPQKNYKKFFKAGVFLPAGGRFLLELGCPLIDRRMILYFVL
jgi:hypothetical protein